MTTRKQLPTVEELHALFRYEDGNLYWRDNQRSGPRAGDLVGTINSMGYRVAQISRVKMRVHRIIWKMQNGTEPAHLDHIDHDTTNNKIENIRDCTHAQNIQNARRKLGASGVRGVRRSHRHDAWEAEVVRCGVSHRAYFSTIEKAAEWVAEKRKELHGEFSCVKTL